jgi:hypothetical protein
VAEQPAAAGDAIKTTSDDSTAIVADQTSADKDADSTATAAEVKKEDTSVNETPAAKIDDSVKKDDVIADPVK